MRTSIISLDLFPQVVAVLHSTDFNCKTFMKCCLLLATLAVKFCPWYIVHRSKVPGTQESVCRGLENDLVVTYVPRRKMEGFNESSYAEKQ